MELMNPWVIVLSAIVALTVFFINLNKKNKYTDGKKVANTKFIKETDYYKQKVKKYKIITTIIKCVSVVLIIVTSILIARPITIETKSEDRYNRDIIIGLDISTSENEVNLELVKKFKKIIPDIKGDRIGIVLFNTAPVVYCPLTEDYDYVNKCLDEIEKQIQKVIDNNGYIPYGFEDNTYSFWYGGAVANYEVRGSSLIGDGLAGTLLSFPDLKTNTSRTRIILFATDNDVAGTETISLDDACSLCRKYNINIYAYCPSVEMNSYTSKTKIESYKKAIEEKAKGKFYTGDLANMSSNMVNEIRDTKTSLLKTSKKRLVIDHPNVFFVIALTLFLGLIVIEKIMKI